MGDVGLFAALGRGTRSRAGLEAASGEGLQPQDLAGPRSGRAHTQRRQQRPEYQGVLAALESSDPKAAHALVTDLLSIAGITTVGGRTVGEIAERFLEAGRNRRRDRAGRPRPGR